MSTSETRGLQDHLGPDSRARTISDAYHCHFRPIRTQRVLSAGAAQFLGRSVLLAISGQLPSGLAMIEVDGLARRMSLFPPGVNLTTLEGNRGWKPLGGCRQRKRRFTGQPSPCNILMRA